MKYILIAALAFLAAFATEKKFKVEQTVPEWNVYFRNVERLQSMAGRGGVPSDLLLATQDTINYFKTTFLVQLNLQADTAVKKADTTKKK